MQNEKTRLKNNLDEDIKNIKMAITLSNTPEGLYVLADDDFNLWSSIHSYMNVETNPISESFERSLLNSLNSSDRESLRLEIYTWLKECLETAESSNTLSSSDIEKLINTQNPFSDILLHTDDRNILTKQLTKSGWYDKDTNSFDVKIVFNGVDVSVKDFNDIIEDWWNRLSLESQKKLGILELESSVNDKASLLVRDKLSTLNDIIGQLQYSFEAEL